MQTHIALTEVTGAAFHLSKLRHKSRCNNLHLRADGIRVARRSNESQVEPIVLIGAFVQKEVGSLIGIGDKEIDIAIIVIVAKGNAAADFV